MPATAILPFCLLLCLLISSTIIHAAAPPPPMGSSTSPTHSNFLRAALQGGRQRYLSCSYNPSVCSNREKNPWGGSSSTCCFQRFCKDTMNDPNHCGFCGRKCGFGLACCGGQCTDTRNDPHHCGSCFKACPGQLKCTFGMCDYGGGDL